MGLRINYRLSVVALGAVLAVTLGNQPARAQFGNTGGISTGGGQLGGSSSFGSGSTSSGMFGNRTVGSGSGLSAGNRTFASGGSGAGGLGVGQSQQLGLLQNGTTGGVTGGARFLRQNRNGAFVGSDQGDLAQSLQLLGGGQNGNLRNTLQNLRNNNNQRRSAQPNQGTGSGGRNALPPYRVSREADFTVRPSAAALAISDRLTQRLNRSASIQTERPVEVEVRGRIAILRGSVATDRARDLAAQLVLLEPGVDQVDNQLQVPGDSDGSQE